MTRIRAGLVGFGKIARDQHRPAMSATDGIELVAVANSKGPADGLTAYPDLAAMLAGEPDLDAVVLCQPPHVRFAAARLALEAGMHVFLEKPPGAAVTEVMALAALARERQRTLFASWHSRYGAAVPLARSWVAAHPPRRIEISWKEDVRIWHPGQEWIWEPGGLGVFDPGINALSILTELLDEPVRLLDAELEIPANRHAPIAARLTMETGSGAPVSAVFDWRQTGPHRWDMVIESDRGTLALTKGGNAVSIDDAVQPVGPEAEYRGLYRRFVDLVRTGASDVDLAPLQITADAFLRGRSCPTEAFVY